MDPGDATGDQRQEFDAMRASCPVARGHNGGWTLYRHGDILRVLLDHETFSNNVSRHLSVPNGMDPPEHADYRRVIEPYFSRERVAAFEPQCRAIAARLVREASGAGPVDFMDAVAGAFAAEVQCAFLGWPAHLHRPLRTWTRRNQEATREQDRERLAELAREFTGQVQALLDERRDALPDSDLTACLMHERVHDRALTDEEIVSILRNWTVGEVGTIAAAVGILAHFLAANPDIQQRLRSNPSLLPAAIDEILRLDGPLVANRRRTTCPVAMDGHEIDAGEQLTLVWIAANRDPAVFELPGEFRLDRDPADNLLYGAGLHVCPGAPLARLELRVFMEELIAATSAIEAGPDRPAIRTTRPAAGFERLPLLLATMQPGPS